MMFEKLKQYLKGDPPPIADQIDDPRLGTLTWSKDDELWVSKNAQCDFAFHISGTPEPDKALLAHAADILAAQDAFVKDVSSFLVQELENKRYLSEFVDEIRQLTIETVGLFWPHRPNDGMIWFNGPDEFRVWRCYYISRKPKGLGFDD